MNEKITVYEKPSCTTCRNLDKFLRERGVDFEKINYYIKPIGEKKLKELLLKMSMSPRDLLRKKENLYKELGLEGSSHSDNELIKLMAEHPDLIQRPIIECGDKAILARPAENVKAIL